MSSLIAEIDKKTIQILMYQISGEKYFSKVFFEVKL